MREVGQREDRDAEALRYGKALCKFVFTSFYLLTTCAHPCLLKDRLPRVAFQLSIILLRTRHVISREMDESGGKDLEQQHPEGISRISTKASAYCEIIDKGRG